MKALSPISHRSAVFSLLLTLFACHSRLSYPPGGYPYPKNLSGKDTQLYRYPIKDKESRRDSMEDALFCADWRSIDEPNLSIRPMPADEFRFTFGCALDPTLYIIRVTPTQMTIRIGNPTDYLANLPDTNRLEPLDRRLAHILEFNYPIDDTTMHHHRRHYLDSMGRLYPQLYDPAYYLTVRNKEFPHHKPWWTFTSRTIVLQPGEFERLVALINQSGYWKLPYDIPPQEDVTDGCGYSLEANTTKQYNFVSTGGACMDTGGFAKACQALVDFAGLQRKVRVAARNTSSSTDTTKTWIVDDVQLEDVKEPPHPNPHPKKPHPNSNK
jgi:hypothetical protein